MEGLCVGLLADGQPVSVRLNTRQLAATLHVETGPVGMILAAVASLLVNVIAVFASLLDQTPK